jgi:hypothetical protein
MHQFEALGGSVYFFLASIEQNDGCPCVITITAQHPQTNGTPHRGKAKEILSTIVEY